MLLLFVVSALAAVSLVNNYKLSNKLAKVSLKAKHLHLKFEEIDDLVFDRMHATDENGISMGLYDSKQVEEVWRKYHRYASEMRRIASKQ